MDRLDENDAVFGEIEKHVESCCYSHLRALEEAIEYAELQEHLRTLEEDDSASGVTVPDGSSTAGKSARLEAAQVKKMNKEIARHVKKKRREATLAKRAAEWGASRARTERAEEALSSWNAGISEDDEPCLGAVRLVKEVGATKPRVYRLRLPRQDIGIHGATIRSVSYAVAQGTSVSERRNECPEADGTKAFERSYDERRRRVVLSARSV